MQQYLTGETIVYTAKNDDCSEFEFSLPEYLPGISRIAKTKVCIEKTLVRNTGSAVFLDLFLKIGIIYISDFEGKIKNAVFRENVSLEFSGTYEDDDKTTAIPSAFISSASSKPSASRKVQTSVCYHGSVTVFRESQKTLFDCDDTENIHMQKDELVTCSKTTLSETLFECKTEITVDDSKPSVGEIIYADAVFCGHTCTFNDKSMDFDGSFLLHTMYESESDNKESTTYTVITTPVNVKESIYDPRITESSMGYVYLDMLSAEPSVSFDGMGENKIMSLSMKYSACPVIFNTEKTQPVTDAFCEFYKSTPQISDIRTDSVKCVVNDSVHLTENIKADLRDISEICDCIAKIMSVSTEYSEGKLFARARCLAEIYGATPAGELTTFETVSTLHIPIPCKENLDTNCTPDVILSIKNCKAKIREGVLECDFEIEMSGVILCTKNIRAVTKLDIDKDLPVTRKKGEIILCYPSKSETLWHLAKKHSISPETLMSANSLESDDISARRVILIP